MIIVNTAKRVVILPNRLDFKNPQSPMDKSNEINPNNNEKEDQVSAYLFSESLSNLAGSMLTKFGRSVNQ